MQRAENKTPLQPLFYILIVALFLLSSSAWAALTATVDRKGIDSNESLQLRVRYAGQASSSEPDFSVLERDFRVLSNNRKLQYSMINGRTESYTDWVLTLAPKRTGRLLIPSIKFRQDISDAIEITVRKASPSNTTGQPVYTETLVDKSSLYVQEQLLLTHRLYTSIQLTDLSMEELDVPEAIVQLVAENQFRKRIGNRDYIVVERKYALFPQASGQLEIPATAISAFQVNNNSNSFFRNRGSQLIRSTEGKTIEVLARPPSFDADQWMPSSQLQISEQWSSKLDKLVVGEPVTRTITISAQGLTGAQIQPLPIQSGNDIKIYPDQPQLSEEKSAGGIIGIRQESLALVPNRAGEIVLPAIRVQWWDTVHRRIQTATLDPVRLQVAPNNSTSAQQPGSNLDKDLTGSRELTPITMANSHNNSDPSLLLKLSLTANALLLALIVGFFMRRSKNRPVTKGNSAAWEINSSRLRLKQQLIAIEKAAGDDDLSAARQAIINWGRIAFPDSAISTLEGITQCCEISSTSQMQGELLEELRRQFKLLDQCLYNNEKGQNIGQLDLKQVAGMLKKMDISYPQSKTRNNGLKPLYPSKNFG